MRSVERRRSRYLRITVASVVVGSALVTLTLRAQEAAAPPSNKPTTVIANPATKPAGTQPASTQPGGAGATSQPSDTPPKPAKDIALNFKDVPLDTVLDYLATAAGYTVIKDGNVEGRVTVVSKQPVQPEAAVALLSAVLKSNNYTAIQEGRVLKVMPRDKAKKTSIPVFYGSDPDQISPTDELITQVIQLRNIDAVKVLGEIQPLRNPDADITASASSNTIIVTDSSSAIRRLARIIKMLDGQETSASDIRIRQLQFANATAAAKLLGEVFKGGGGGGMSPQQIQMMQMQGQPIPQGGGGREGFIPGSGIDQALRGGRVNASADERTNTIVITAPAETLKVIDDILDKLDSNPSAGTSQIHVFPLNYAIAEDTAKLISSLFKGDEGNNNNYDYYFWSPRRNSGDSALKVKVEAEFDERTNSVIVTAPEPTLKIIEGLIKELDANPITVTDLKVFHLQNATAFDVSYLLEDIFKPKADSGGGNDVIRYFYYEGGGQPNKKAPKMTAVNDDRTNSVIVTAPKEMMKAIEDVITQLDTNPAAEEDLFIYKLRNAQSSNLEFVLNTLFGNYAQPGQNQNGDQDPNARNYNNNNNNNRNNNNNNNRGNDRNNNGNRNNRNNRNNRRQGNMPNMNQGLQRAAGELTGKVFVVADVDTNALLVTTASKYKDQVRRIIDELDKPVPQVLIKVLVAEIRHTDDVDYGVDFSIMNQRPSGNGQTGGANFGNAAAGLSSGGLVVSVLETNFSATLHALAQAGKLDVLSRPYILASDNQLASIQVGQDVPLIQTTRFQEGNGDQINTFDYRSVGILLDVTPHINPDGQVILDVEPEISSLGQSNILVQPGVTAPIIDTRRAESRVEVASGQTIVIGGLMEDRRESVVQKVPWLGDIPLVGEAFRRTRVNKVKTELLIFLTPHVAQETSALTPMNADEMQGLKLVPNAGGPGMFQEHMKGMRRGDVPLTQPSSPNGTGPYVPTAPTPSPTTHPSSSSPDASSTSTSRPSPTPFPHGVEIGGIRRELPTEPATQPSARGPAE